MQDGSVVGRDAMKTRKRGKRWIGKKTSRSVNECQKWESVRNEGQECSSLDQNYKRARGASEVQDEKGEMEGGIRREIAKKQGRCSGSTSPEQPLGPWIQGETDGGTVGRVAIAECLDSGRSVVGSTGGVTQPSDEIPRYLQIRTPPRRRAAVGVHCWGMRLAEPLLHLHLVSGQGQDCCCPGRVRTSRMLPCHQSSHHLRKHDTTKCRPSC